MEPSVAKHARQQAAVVVPACNPCWHPVYGTQHSLRHTSSGQFSCFDASSPYAGAGGDTVGTGCTRPLQQRHTRAQASHGEQHEPVATSRRLDSRVCTAHDAQQRLYQRVDWSPYAGARGDAVGTGCMPGQSHSVIATTTHESLTSIITLAA